MGMHQAFPDAEIIGVDLAPQPRYPFTFRQGDALTYPLEGFDFVWASPPCQGYSIMRNLPWLRDKEYPMLIPLVRERLQDWGGHWAIENVMGAQRVAGMQAGWLCGGMFGRPFRRHRVFETNWPWFQPGHPNHHAERRSEAEREAHRGLTGWQRANGAQKRGVGIGHAAGWRQAAEAMGIDWMDSAGLTQAVPPVYAHYLLTAYRSFLCSERGEKSDADKRGNAEHPGAGPEGDAGVSRQLA